VAVAVGAGVPAVEDVLRGVFEALEDAGVDLALTTVVSVQPATELVRLQSAPGPLKRLLADVGLQRHDPDDEAALAMVAVASGGVPLRLNRTLAESDVVLPVVAAHLDPAGNGAFAKFAGLFPEFSNRETLDRFSAIRSGASPKKRAELTAEIDEAGWLLGVGLMVDVVAGPGGAACVLAGEPGSVARAAADRWRSIWEKPVAQQGDLVIAALAGAEDEQTWENLARALVAAEHVLRPDGAIAVCSNLADMPCGAFETLVDAVDWDAVQRDLRRDAGHNARPALALARALERGPVFLKSRLPPEVVESLGMTPIETDAELSRLASSREHCVVIEEAQRLQPRFVGDLK
jgi:hypothetical protein